MEEFRGLAVRCNSCSVRQQPRELSKWILCVWSFFLPARVSFCGAGRPATETAFVIVDPLTNGPGLVAALNDFGLESSMSGPSADIRLTIAVEEAQLAKTLSQLETV